MLYKLFIYKTSVHTVAAPAIDICNRVVSTWPPYALEKNDAHHFMLDFDTDTTAERLRSLLGDKCKVYSRTLATASGEVGYLCVATSYEQAPAVLLPDVISGWRPDAGSILLLSEFVAAIAIVLLGLYFCFRNIRRLRANGRASIRRLHDSGLEEAAKEYGSDQKITLPLSDFKNTGSVFTSRENAVTPSFIFDISENIIYRYEDISRISITDHIRRSRTQTRKTDVLTFRPLEGEAFPLMSVPYGIYNQKAANAIKQIVFIMKHKNPECCIDESVTDSCEL